jgi:hypothetical protein
MKSIQTIIFSLTPILIWAQVSLTGFGVSNKYVQDFNATTAAVPAGWSFFETGSNANTSFATGTGSNNAGDTYFLGTGGEWCFGGLQSGSLIPRVGAYFTNNTGGTISSITISYKGETWRVGNTNRSDRIEFGYSLNATSLNNGTWIPVAALNYSNPGQAATASGSQLHSSVITSTISGLNIANGANFFIRWTDLDVTGSDDAMGVDDFELFVHACAQPALPSSSVSGGTEQCVDNGWTYYGTATDRYFALFKNGNTLNVTANVLVGTFSTPMSSNGVNLQNQLFLMNRLWNVTLNSGSISSSNPVKVRFYYNPNELTAAQSARNSAYAALTGTNSVTNGASVEWFRTLTVPMNAAFVSGIVGNTFPSPVIKFNTSPNTASIGITTNGVTYVELEGITSLTSGGGGGFSFGPPNGGGNNSLPVTWIAVEAKRMEENIVLDWQTGSEYNSDYFIVETSQNGQDFVSIGEQIPAAKYSQTKQSYRTSFPDLPENNYFRIKQIDQDGSATYSKTIQIEQPRDLSPNISLHPTKLSSPDAIVLTYNNLDRESIQIQIVDILGRVVYQNNVALNPIETTKKIELPPIIPGNYSALLTSSNYHKMIKIIIE